ncbi:MAG: 2-(1,2-epoxy-1,2-dihydrophenyl)acetyl-CoA isomerase PaaG [Acidobacteriota bacterium]|nr:2-(1,2-epoxy-1,2-dihydrophenyl)acetyl-CoA isomerase PaaG [Acidobacteriota bacterium]
MEYKYILYAFEAGVATITLNRTRKLNSFNRAMAEEVQAALAVCSKDDQVRAVLLTGAGDGFCAGQDLKEVLPKQGEPLPVLGDTVAANYNPTILAIRNLEKPVICAVNGVAAGAGANIALACDFVIASEKAEFVQSFAAIGLVPDSGGTFFLPRLVGLPRATAMAMLGDKIKAREAQDMGLIYKAEPHPLFLEEARKLAQLLATRPTRGLGLTKKAFNQSLNNDLETQLQLERDYQTELGNSHDYNEGVAAFLEKRKPQYRGN